MPIAALTRALATGRSKLPALGRRERHDVVFYVPGVGSLISLQSASPAGGAETQALLLAKALARRGLRVAMIVYGNREELPLQVDGVRIEPRAPYRRRGSVIGKVDEAARIWAALWRTEAPTVITRCAGVQVGLAALFSKLSRRRFVYASAAVADFERRALMTNRRDDLLYRAGVRLADAIVVQTEEQVDLCTAEFNRKPQLIKSIVLPSSPAAGGAEAFLWVGRLVSYKRPLDYVELARSLPQARFWLVGVPGVNDTEDLGPAVLVAAAELPNLELLAPRSQMGIGELIGRAVACVNTSDFEGMPNVLLEGWSRGVPALAFRHDPGGVIETHGLGGFANGSRERLQELARALWEGPDAERAARCRAYVAEHHAPDAVVDRWLEVLTTDDSTSALEPGRRGLHPSA